MSKAADAIPIVAVSIEYNLVFAVRSRLAVFADKKIHQALAFFHSNVKVDAFGFFVEVVQSDEGVVSPVIAHRKNAAVAGFQNLVLAPTELATLFTTADHSFRPVEHRVRSASLRLYVDVTLP